MSVPLSAKFYNQIYEPACDFLKLLASHPFSIEPESNKLIHQFEGLMLHINHFAERNDLPLLNAELKKDQQFRDLANSIKHIRGNREQQVTCELALIYEVKDESFRFIRNTIISRYDYKNESFDAIEKVCRTVEKYFRFVGFTSGHIDIPESEYSTYSWAFTYVMDNLAAITKRTRIITVRKEGNEYTNFSPKELIFVGFDKTLIGQDPLPYFPKV